MRAPFDRCVVAGSVSGGLKKRMGSADPACRPLPFSIVLADREPRTGYGNTNILICERQK